MWSYAWLVAWHTWRSIGVISDGSYGTPDGVVFSFPVQTSDKTWSIVKGLNIDDFAKSKIEITGKELEEEKNEAMAVCQADWLAGPAESKLWTNANPASLVIVLQTLR